MCSGSGYATGGALVRRPSDLGFDDSAYELPKLHLHEHPETEMPTNGMLFASEAQTLSERRDARRMSIADRVNDCARIVNADREPWIVWCDLNAEGDELRKAIPDAVEIRGNDDIEVKERRLPSLQPGQIRVLVTKPSIAGFGLNWQHCARMAFVGGPTRSRAITSGSSLLAFRQKARRACSRLHVKRRRSGNCEPAP